MPLKDKVIVVLGNTRFNGSIQATSLFIARNLAKHNKVYFIEHPYTIRDYFNSAYANELEARKKSFSLLEEGVISTDLVNLKVIITPPVLPINFLPEGLVYRTALKVNEGIIGRSIKKVLKNEGVKDFIYINAFNFHFPDVADRIKPALTVYQCVDPMVIPYDMKHGIISENKLVRESDLVICTSKALYQEKKELNPNTYLVPNAADVEHCSRALDPKLPVHPILKDFPRPIIGYIGSIERRIDFDLVTDIVQANPDKTFVFAGPYWKDYIPEVLFNTPNVHLTGPVPYNEVPQLVKGFDVTIIPFKKDDVSRTIFPLKLFEYLSAGKPVIVTDFNLDLKDYTNGVVAYCSNTASFNNAINEALKTNDPIKIEKRVAIASENSWPKRAEEVERILGTYLN